MTNRKQLKAESLLVSAGRSNRQAEPLNIPPTPASNFLLGGSREYARDDGTDAWEALEAIVGGLEGGEAVAFSSGMGAIAAVFDQVASGSVVAIPTDCYQAVVGLAEAGKDKGFWRVERIAVDDTRGWIEAAKHADLLWLESPSNPLLEVADLVAICGATRKAESILAIDNTFATPLNQAPLLLGADVSVHSATKFIGGHSDLLAGVATTKKPHLLAALKNTRLLNGATPGALETFLAIRGARTLALLLRRAEDTAGVLAARLEKHPKVSVTRYPGLTSHRHHEIARTQLKGFGTIISFDVRGGAEEADAVCEKVELIQHATSLGAVESTMERRAAIAGQEHLPAALLRLSVGIEDLDDLWRDLDQALQSAGSLSTSPARRHFARSASTRHDADERA